MLPAAGRGRRQRYSDREILLALLWAVLHDRPVAWACDRTNWPSRRGQRRLPHASTVSRRARGPRWDEYLNHAHERLRDLLVNSTRAAFIDGKPLLVSDDSRDPDAHDGRAMRRFRRGYKLHAVVDEEGVVQTFDVHSLNVQERTAAHELLPRLPDRVRRVVADGNDDSGRLHARLEPLGVKLYTPLIRSYAGPRSHPRRRRLARIMARPIGTRITHAREHVERQFGLIGNLGFGLKGLPNWVRRQHLVHRWVSCKLLLFHVWKLHRELTA